MSDSTTAKPSQKGRAALGRGLGALLGDARREEPVATGGRRSGSSSASRSQMGEGLAMLAVSSIEPHPDNPRVHFAEGALDDLAKSIAARGVIQPVIVRPGKDGTYQLVAGERRWRAAQKAQVHEIPAIVRDLDERDVTALALIENIQREDLNPVEEARAYHKLATRDSMSQADIADLVEKSRSHVANLMRLLSLPEPVLVMVEMGELTMGHARALINCEVAEEIAKQAAGGKLSVRDVEKRVRKASSKDAPKRRAARPPRDADDADIVAVQRHLEDFLGLPVQIKADADPKSGQVIVRYNTLDQLDLVCQRLSGGEI
ncbi:ParB/RepB/Spo0J family partition protein [Croceicoccus ponticola]|uniref:ParB/RepB/Spo0J family partition protein n=1 Tax=Croceicoccus ponticola TaxID=2217664 RepID=A0A437GYF5_9SPHN|nr:ParB/RepB/Spo0J family partition protein [Croceicoccus ponticola]RVQ67714.1 ParB/RepB/Spo0J family partition protein [Croceicoccus ponticola]